MKQYNFNQEINRVGTNAVKWEHQSKPYGKEGLLPFWVADGDVQVPNEVVDGLKQRVEHGIFGYDAPSETYYQAVESWLKQKHEIDIDRELIQPTAGIVPSLAFAVEAFSAPGDKVIVQTPVYNPFFDVIERNQRQLVINPLKQVNNRFEMDFCGLEKELQDGVKVMILCSPHNPVGRVWTKEELDEVVQLCMKYDVFLVSDEIHCDLVFQGHQHYSIARYKGQYEKIMVCTAPSKTFNIAGLQISNILFANKEYKEQFNTACATKHWGEPNGLGLVGCTQAYTYGHQWLEEFIAHIEENVAIVKQYGQENMPLVKIAESEGTYLLWIDFSCLGLKQQELEQIFVDHGLALGKGSVYRGEQQGVMRLNIACPQSQLQKGLEQIKVIYDEKVNG